MGLRQSQLHTDGRVLRWISDTTGILISDFKLQLLCLLTDDKEINQLLGEGRTLCLCKIRDLLRKCKELSLKLETTHKHEARQQTLIRIGNFAHIINDKEIRRPIVI